MLRCAALSRLFIPLQPRQLPPTPTHDNSPTIFLCFPRPPTSHSVVAVAFTFFLNLFFTLNNIDLCVLLWTVASRHSYQFHSDTLLPVR